MATSLVKIRTEKFYVITQDFTHQEFASLEQAFKSGGKCIVRELWGQRDATDSRQTGFEYQLFSAPKKECSLESQGWKIENIALSGDAKVNIHNHSFVTCEISDPEAMRREMTFAEGIQGLAEALKFVFETSKMSNWQHHLLILENEELKERVWLLEQKVEVMNSFMAD